MIAKTLYEILEINEKATSHELKKAYYRLANLYHPDKQGEAASEEKFKEVSAAYDLLKNPEKRSQYDLLLLRSRQKERYEELPLWFEDFMETGEWPEENDAPVQSVLDEVLDDLRKISSFFDEIFGKSSGSSFFDRRDDSNYRHYDDLLW